MLPWRFPSTVPSPSPSTSWRSVTTDNLVRTGHFSSPRTHCQRGMLHLVAELCLLSDTKGGFEVDGLCQINVASFRGASENNNLKQGEGLFGTFLSPPGDQILVISAICFYFISFSSFGRAGGAQETFPGAFSSACQHKVLSAPAAYKGPGGARGSRCSSECGERRQRGYY